MSRRLKSEPNVCSGYDDCLAAEVGLRVGQSRELRDEERADEVLGTGRWSMEVLQRLRADLGMPKWSCTHRLKYANGLHIAEDRQVNCSAVLLDDQLLLTISWRSNCIVKADAMSWSLPACFLKRDPNSMTSYPRQNLWRSPTPSSLWDRARPALIAFESCAMVRTGDAEACGMIVGGEIRGS